MSNGFAARASFRSHLLTIILALVGLADAVYLTAEHFAGRSLRCTLISGCDEVLASSYAMLFGAIPLAALGVLAYFAVFSLATLAIFGSPRAARLLPPLVAVMFVMTLWLLYVQAFILKTYCQFCLLSALITFVLAMVTLIGWWQRRNAKLR